METSEAPAIKKQPLIETLTRKVMSPERATEFLSGQIMMGLEIMHDMDLYPAKYDLMPSQVGSLPDPNTNPVAAWAIEHIGDMWEISVGFTAIRIGFVAVNEALKSDRVRGLQKELLKNDKTKEIVGKVIGVDRTNKLASGEAIQISDEACFWASLTTICTVQAFHSLGYIPYNVSFIPGVPNYDYTGHPETGMLFGQGVAAVVLAASHYAGKYHESIKDLAEKGIRSVFGSKESNIPSNIAVDVGGQTKE